MVSADGMRIGAQAMGEGYSLSGVWQCMWPLPAILQHETDGAATVCCYRIRGPIRRAGSK